MKQSKISRSKLKLLFFSCVATLLLTSCVKMQAVVDVKADGSGMLGIALGMTQQAKNLLSNLGQDPMTQIGRRLGEFTSNGAEMQQGSP
jgi:hypothetical protein